MKKVCSRCGEGKEPSEYNKDSSKRDGLASRCRACNKAVCKQWATDNAQKMREYQAERYKSNRGEFIKRAAGHYKANKESKIRYVAEWRQNNPDKVAAYTKKYAAQNKHKKMARTRARQAKKQQASPQWANNKYIELFYLLAKMEAKRTGRSVHVDHIIPLGGEKVCGLHCEDNLQLLFQEDNLRKHNKFDPNNLKVFA